MTYLQFHFVFILPAVVLLALGARGLPARVGTRMRWALPLMALIALAWTTPWDNYLVYRGVWSYGADRVIGIIGWVPVEEYLFFLLQPLLTGFWCCHVLARVTARPRAGASRRSGLIGYALLSAAGAAMLLYERTLYLGLILAWAAPVLLGQWWLAGAWLAERPRAFLLAVAPPTLYLWLADRIAIGLGIWSISPRYTTGAHLLGLPLEEAVFFLVTNLLVVQGLVLFLQPWQQRAVQRPTVPV